MKILTAVVLIAPLALPGLPTGAAAQSAPPPPPPASSTSNSDRESYTRQTQNDMHDWQQKLHDLGDAVKTKGQRVSSDAQENLNRAWANAQVQAEKVRTATADGWDNAKAGFQKASRDLADAWDRVRNGNK